MRSVGKRFVAQYQRYKEQGIVVSLDLHDESSYLVAVDVNTGEVLADENIRAGVPKVVAYVSGLGFERERTEVIYEAGNQGFYPQRLFTAAGYRCSVIAPTSIPKRGKKRKTDRDDAWSNLEFHVAGLLKYVFVPQLEDEEVRECLRHRHKVCCRATKLKQKILSYCKRRGLHYTLTRSNWTVKHYQWLRSVEASAVVRMLLDVHLDELQQAQEKLDTVEGALNEALGATAQYKYYYDYYRFLPGFGHIGSMAAVLEGGALDRFGHPDTLMNFSGLVPKKSSSGNADPALHITKAGNRYLRLALVRAAAAYGDGRVMRRAIANAKCIEDERLRCFMLKLIARLSARYRLLRARKKHPNTIKCAVARELCGFLWELYVKVIPPFTAAEAA
jgi:transposase